MKTENQAANAVKAANGNWGRWATRKFLERNGVNPRLYYLARTLLAAKKAGF